MDLISIASQAKTTCGAVGKSWNPICKAFLKIPLIFEFKVFHLDMHLSFNYANSLYIFQASPFILVAWLSTIFHSINFGPIYDFFIIIIKT